MMYIIEFFTTMPLFFQIYLAVSCNIHRLKPLGHMKLLDVMDAYIDGLVEDCRNPSTLAMGLLQFLTSPSVCISKRSHYWCRHVAVSMPGHYRTQLSHVVY